MEVEDKKTFKIADTTVKLQVITGLSSMKDETEHFCIMISDLSCHNNVFFNNRRDANTCFNSFLKMKTFDD